MDESPNSTGSVTLEVQGRTAQIVIDHQQHRNALTIGMINELVEVVNHLAQRDDLNCCILVGGGTDFCAGADQYEVANRLDRDFATWLTESLSETLAVLERLPLLTVAAMSGVALGGGLELALACKVRIATSDVRLGMVQVRNGLSSAWGGHTRLTEIVGHGMAVLLAATGRVVDAYDAASIGLVDDVVKPKGALAAATRLADQVASQPTAAVRSIVRDIGEARLSTRPADVFVRESATFVELWGGPAHITATERWRH